MEPTIKPKKFVKNPIKGTKFTIAISSAKAFDMVSLLTFDIDVDIFLLKNY